MLEQLSSQYYIGRVYIEPLYADEEYGQLNNGDYTKIKQQIYGKTIQQPPLMMKLENQHLLLKPSESVPKDTIQISEEAIEQSTLTSVPSLEEVFFPTKEAVEKFKKVGFLP